MADIYWVGILIVSGITTLLCLPLIKHKDDRPILILSSIFFFTSLLVVVGYINCPQKYSQKKIERKLINVYNGRYTEPVEIVTTYKLEATNYLFGIIKDSSVKWVEE